MTSLPVKVNSTRSYSVPVQPCSVSALKAVKRRLWLFRGDTCRSSGGHGVSLIPGAVGFTSSHLWDVPGVVVHL
ncbi:hypothetical protein EYF80_045111 [Liparis tanakae]|uniref:Uncharacterized protein n=1 Tax=Liparis tanakae TaxID=230148 RepID=A0A4Z2FWF6_9TELE|nr:hypothetical protein EYF80_045111 [Liparis tanakae]